METNVRTPMDVFALPQHLVVPLFQRPYVWTEAEQWMPLWQDIRRLTELRLREPQTNASHFLGAVVLQANGGQTGNLPARNIIDGQQRLTTLQILMDAAASVLEEAELESLAGQLEILTHNLHLYVSGNDTRLKLRHSNRDRAAFDEVMTADPPVDYSSLTHSGSRLAHSHRFFEASVREWLNESSQAEARANALVQVLTRGLQLVVIDLQAQENSQEIFETLNARGTPLTAADLVKNFVFQKLEVEGVDTRQAYADDWPFDTPFWEREVSVGRLSLSRSSLFLNQWMGARVGEEISPKSIFTRFKHYIEHECGRPMSQILVHIKEMAALYQGWTIAAEDPDRTLTPDEMAVYRMNAAGVELLKPILLWLNDPELRIPSAVADQVIASVESWVIRRQLLRLPSADLGRIVADLIRSHRSAPPDELAQLVKEHLTRLTSPSTYWPGDDEVRTSLMTENAYRRFPRSRLRMYLEAVEDDLRSKYRYPPVPRRGYPIEHVMPQKWEEHWPVATLEAQIDRGAHIHRLGNLTLLTESLNASVSNGRWKRKRDKVARHDVFLMNRLFRDAAAESGWDEASIDARSSDMIEALLATWPVPDGHNGRSADTPKDDRTWVEVRHLVAAGLLPVGTRLTPRSAAWGAAAATVQSDGRIEVDGHVYDTPSGAGKHIRGRATNGWYFWRLPDGRKLSDLRAAYQGDKPEQQARPPFDWSGLHSILEALPEGSWTTYGDLADAVGTAPQPLGRHIVECAQCANAHRVLTHDGRVAEQFRWPDPSDTRDPQTMLQNEGVAFSGSTADPDKRLSGDDLTLIAGNA